VTATLAPVSIALAMLSPAASAADLYHGVPTPLAEPQCLLDPTLAFVADRPPPEDRFSLIVRHLGDDALEVGTPYDFGTLQGIPLTGLSVPEPRGLWQRAKSLLDPNYTSAFQAHCYDAGFFINTWHFEPQVLIDEGPHVVYGFAFSEPPRAFDENPSTDLAIQVLLEIPWLFRPQGRAIEQVYFQIRFHDPGSNRSLQTTYLLHQNTGVDFSPYAEYARNDSLFVASPASTNAVVTRSPYSAPADAGTWAGLRFYRSQITQANFRAAVALANAFCTKRPDIPDCTPPPGRDAALSGDPAAYRISEFSLITEVFDADTDANGLSVGLHVRGLGLYNFR
jgi:hypothetical protein